MQIWVGNMLQMWIACHIIRDCPKNVLGGRNSANPSNKLNQRRLAQACVYAITPGEVDDKAPGVEETEVITGIFRKVSLLLLEVSPLF